MSSPIASPGEWIDSYKWNSKTQASCFVLVLYTFLFTFTPSEAYLVPFLTRLKPFTPQEVSLLIFPYGIYATLIFTLLAAPACHFFSHRTVIIMGTLSNAISFVLLYYLESLFVMEINQVFYGLGMAARLVFSSYIFVIIPEQDYQVMTSYTQASSLISYLVASELGQFLVDRGASLIFLLQISVTFAILACIVSFFLPREVPESLEILETPFLRLNPGRTVQGVWGMIRETWQGQNLRLLSLWWVFGTAGFSMTLNYGVNLFDEINPDTNSYGHIMAASQGAGSLGALAGVKLANLAAQTGGLVYVLGTFASGGLCIIMAWSNSLWIAQPAYASAIGINQLLLCLIYVQCAKSLSNREFILLFSFNAVAALLVQSAIQGGVELLQLSMKHQFYVYGGYCMALAVVFWLLCLKNFSSTGSVMIIPADDES